MLCDICGKNEATIHIKEIIGKEKKSLNLCGDCAARQEKAGKLKFGELDLTEVLFNLQKLGGGKNMIESASDAAAEVASAVCPECGWTLQKIRESGGLLGCARCYVTFAGPICEAIGNVHRGKQHLGKRPENLENDRLGELRSELTMLKRQLDKLVTGERYEEAAVVRDQIRELGSKLESAEKSDRGPKRKAAGKSEKDPKE